MNRFDAQRENTNLGADHGCTGHAYVWGPHVTSGLYGAPLDYREASSIYFDPGSWQSRYNNRQLNFTLEYRDFQLMQIGPGNTALVGPELQPGTGADAMENGSQFTLPSLPGRLAITRQLARMVGRRRAPTKAGSEPPTRGNPGTFAAN